MNGWKTLTDMAVNAESIKRIEAYCSELLIHAADVEGLCQGIDMELVERECGTSRVEGEDCWLCGSPARPDAAWSAVLSDAQTSLTHRSGGMGFHSMHVRGWSEGSRRPGPGRPVVQRQG